MATNAVVEKTGAQCVLADHLTDFTTPTAKNDFTLAGYTDVQCDLTSLGNDAGREAAKLDLGAVRAPSYTIDGALESAATPFTTGERIDIYDSPSHNATASDGNLGNMDGVDGAAPSGEGTLDELLQKLDFVGSGIVENTASTVQSMVFNKEWEPAHRYHSFVIVNRATGILIANADEHHITITENLPDIQAAA